jgi:hypothetical protein
VNLLERLRVLLAVHEHLRVVIARGVIIRREFQDAFQQELGIVQNLEFHSDSGEQAHPFDVGGVLLQELTNHLLGGVRLPL